MLLRMEKRNTKISQIKTTNMKILTGITALIGMAFWKMNRIQDAIVCILIAILIYIMQIEENTRKQ